MRKSLYIKPNYREYIIELENRGVNFSHFVCEKIKEEVETPDESDKVRKLRKNIIYYNTTKEYKEKCALEGYVFNEKEVIEYRGKMSEKLLPFAEIKSDTTYIDLCKPLKSYFKSTKEVRGKKMSFYEDSTKSVYFEEKVSTEKEVIDVLEKNSYFLKEDAEIANKKYHKKLHKAYEDTIKYIDKWIQEYGSEYLKNNKENFSLLSNEYQCFLEEYLQMNTALSLSLTRSSGVFSEGLRIITSLMKEQKVVDLFSVDLQRKFGGDTAITVATKYCNLIKVTVDYKLIEFENDCIVF